MSNDLGSETPKWLALLSVAGSVASIIALLIVLIQQAAPEPGAPTQLVVWRLIFAAIALVATGATVVFTYIYCRNVHLSQLSPGKKLVRISLGIMIGLLISGICLDGFFAALYWTWWLQPLRNLFRQIFSA
jgi:hypothetical protein